MASAFVFLTLLIALAACAGGQTQPAVNNPILAGPTVSQSTTSTPEPKPPTAMPEPTPTPTSETSPEQFMLQLINRERGKAGAAPVELGSNRAAQIHADNSLANCHSGHWSMDGLKPYMRYSLAGGYQLHEENVSGDHYCFEMQRFDSLETALTGAMTVLMNSDGHRENILNPTHRAVSLGISWDDYLNIAVVQIFEGEYVKYRNLPQIRDGILSLSGTAVGGVVFSSEEDLIVALHWDPPPRALTRGQLARTSSYGDGVPIAGVSSPSYLEEIPARSTTYLPSFDPHSVPADSPPPQSPEESKALYEEAQRAIVELELVTGSLPMLGASVWKVSTHDFDVVADVGEVLEEYGPGVYTLHVRWVRDEKCCVISMYSIWQGIERPGGYQ